MPEQLKESFDNRETEEAFQNRISLQLHKNSRMALRKVVFARWLTSAERNGGPNQKVLNCQGFFHRWGSTYEHYDAGPGNRSIAIVEGEDGRVFEVHPDDLKFIP